jgi:hypothetical protein
MDTDKIKIYGSRVQVDSLTKVAEIEQAEKQKMAKKVEKIIAHGCNVFINRQLIYNYPESLFAKAGVMAIEHADFDGVERLAAVTGGDVVSTFDSPDKVTLGECDVLEEVSGTIILHSFDILLFHLSKACFSHLFIYFNYLIIFLFGIDSYWRNQGPSLGRVQIRCRLYYCPSRQQYPHFGRSRTLLARRPLYFRCHFEIPPPYLRRWLHRSPHEPRH